MEFLIISGLSGAGKSRTMDVLEDLNYYCVDNMPVVLIPKFAELCIATRSRYEKVALVTDVREKEDSSQLFEALDALWELGCEYKILFVEADVGTIVKRYKETRRRHPLGGDTLQIEEAVRLEVERMAPMRERADYVINTTNYKTAELQSELYELFASEGGARVLRVNIVSFGFKYGLPLDADLIFDVRFLPNPFYVASLRQLTGVDSAVSEFVFENGDAYEFLHRLCALLEFLLPLYVEEGKYSLTIGIGCTGGKHRSVAIARELVRFVNEKGHHVQIIDRDMDKDASPASS